MQEERFIYLDGNNNKYIVTDTSLHYLPVQEHESSSGTYSGGKSKMTVLSDAQFEELVSAFKKALESSLDHAMDREKGTSLVSDVTDKRSVILRQRSVSLKALEDLLRRFLHH